MSVRDVRDILSLPQGSSAGTPSSSAKKSLKSSKPRPPRGSGITKELYALIGDNAPPLTLAAARTPAFKERIQEAGQQRAVKWAWAAFENTARKDGLKLWHWVKSDTLSESTGMETEPYKFAKYNTSSNPFSYSSEEYLHHLRDDEWSREETDYLFNLLQAYDLRFPVVHDRYDFPGGPSRSLEALKARYYSVCAKLLAARPSADENDRKNQIAAHAFDPGREAERKAHVAGLVWRTPAQIAEEDFLYIESRRLEQNAQRMAADKEALMQTLDGITKRMISQGLEAGAAGNPGSSALATGTGAIAGPSSQRRSAAPGARRSDLYGGVDDLLEPLDPVTAGKKVSRATLAADALTCVFRFEDRPPSSLPSVSLRSNRVAAPKASIAARVSSVLTELGMPATGKQLVMPTRANVARLEELQAAAAALVDMKRQVERVEQEIKVLGNKREVSVARSAAVAEASGIKRSPSVSSVGSAAQSRKRPRRG